MSKTFTDLSQLTKAILHKDEPHPASQGYAVAGKLAAKPAPAHAPIPHPPKKGAMAAAQVAAPDADSPEGAALSREETDCLAYFAHTSLTDPRYATAGRAKTPTPAHGGAVPQSPTVAASTAAASAAAKAAQAQLAADLAATRAELLLAQQALVVAERRAAAAEQAVQAHAAAESAWRQERERLLGELRTLRAMAAKAPDVAAAPAPVPTPAPPASRAQKGVLAPPAAFSEAFPGELRELLLATLAESHDAARQSGRDRRAAALDAVLSANPPTGELARRRAALKQILKDAGYYTDPRALESLGFRLVSGKTHWKLEYAGIRMPIAKTPSDYRAHLNMSADMANRCF